MKQWLAVMIGAMAIGGAVTSSALAAPATTGTRDGSGDDSGWVDNTNYLRNELRLGMNLVELKDSGSIVIERVVGNLFVYATSSAERQPMPDGTYRLRRAAVSECEVRDGSIVWCR